MADQYAALPTVPMSPVFALADRFKASTIADKASLGIGAFRDDDGQPWVLPTVIRAEEIMVAKLKAGQSNHEYLPISGNPEFVSAAISFALGAENPAIHEQRTGGVQTIGGTGAVSLAAQFVGTHHSCKTVLIPNPTWGNHNNIFQRAGMKIQPYRYYRSSDRSLDFEGLCADLTAAEENSVVLLHACAHNPTGVDPTAEQWLEIANICRARKLFPIFDLAYQGFVSGNPDEDAASVREFVKQGFSLLLCQSFSKNMGLYNERVGNLAVVFQSQSVVNAVLSQLRVIVRSLWSNPSNHGSRIAATILTSDALRAEWRQELATMSGRILRMRQSLHSALVECGAPGDWSHILNQRGMFTYSGLNATQVRALEEKHGVFLLASGRMNMCGVTPGNVHRIARAIRDVLAPEDPAALATAKL
eukprot:m.137532 g.137532  ORF g.137532 m.137532 type:complete len:418 (+) comp52507_c0_seq2:71-1324(+)